MKIGDTLLGDTTCTIVTADKATYRTYTCPAKRQDGPSGPFRRSDLLAFQGRCHILIVVFIMIEAYSYDQLPRELETIADRGIDGEMSKRVLIYDRNRSRLREILINF